jgi:RluA family pseudouridine synthase
LKYQSFVHLDKNSPPRFLAEYLTGRFTYYSYQDWVEKIHEGKIFVNGLPGKMDQMLSHGDHVEYQLNSSELFEPAVNKDWKLLYQDRWLFIVDKPSDIPVHPAGGYRKNTLLTLLKETYPDLNFYPCHRLDRETSGVLVFALDPETVSEMHSRFQKHRVEKEYLAIIFGKAPEKFSVKGWIAREPRAGIRKKMKLFPAEVEDGKYSETDFYLESYKDGFSLLKCIPKHGRLHQIRSSLHSKGYPILGDKIYGPSDEAFLEFIEHGLTENVIKIAGHHRQALHSHKLEFNHPKTDQLIKIISPLPEDLLGFV